MGISAELEAYLNKDTLELLRRVAVMNTLRIKWVFTVKETQLLLGVH